MGKLRSFRLWLIHAIKLALEKCMWCKRRGVESTSHGARLCKTCGIEVELQIQKGIK